MAEADVSLRDALDGLRSRILASPSFRSSVVDGIVDATLGMMQHFEPEDPGDIEMMVRAVCERLGVRVVSAS